MINHTQLRDIRPQPTHRQLTGVYNDGRYTVNVETFSDVIYTLDIETTSVFLDDEGNAEIFDYMKDPDYYRDRRKAAVMYIGMFGVEDTVYYFRTWEQFNKILQKISNANITKIIYVHNLAFEFQFLRSLFDKEGYTVERMLARETRKPITFKIKELNIIFRCSLCLTNLSLQKSAEKYNKVYFKLAGDLDYNVLRGYNTKLTDTELGYCENDITTLFEIIYRFRKEYGHVERIPLTQTGEVRRAFKKFSSPFYKEDVRQLIPQNADIFLLLMGAFSGGLTHSNYIRTGKLYHDVTSRDLCSSYPTAMLHKYPMSQFWKIAPEDFLLYNKGSFALLMCVRFTNISCKYINAYIPAFKCKTLQGEVLDNGRVISAQAVEIILTDIDYDIITSSYDIEQIDYVSIYASHYGYLPKELLLFMLELYRDKTTLKGIPEEEAYYMKKKQMLNSLFGCCCTNVIRQDISYVNGEWQPHAELTNEYVEGKLQKQRESKSNLFAYQWGVWITAHARKSLYLTLTGRDQNYNEVDKTMDFDTVYYDTDSIKYLHEDEHDKIFELYNQWITEKLQETCAHYKISFDKLAPEDQEGKEHPLGIFEFDGHYTEFITLGSKRYAYRSAKDSELHTTIAGVSTKTGVNALHGDINNFEKGLLFDYDTAGKLISNYNDDQPEIIIKDDQGNEDIYSDKYGVCLQPTTYELCVDNYYDMLLQWANEVSQMNDELKKRFNKKG